MESQIGRREFLTATAKTVAGIAVMKLCFRNTAAADDSKSATQSAGTGGKRKGKLVAACGLYCGACPNFMPPGSTKSGKQGSKCPGCANKIDNKCAIAKCAKTHRVETCGQCDQYPCPDIKAFHKDKGSHRTMAAHNLDVIKEKGMPAWLEEQDGRWRCSKCRATVTWDAKVCLKCGTKLKTLENDVKELGLG